MTKPMAAKTMGILQRIVSELWTAQLLRIKTSSFVQIHTHEPKDRIKSNSKGQQRLNNI